MGIIAVSEGSSSLTPKIGEDATPLRKELILALCKVPEWRLFHLRGTIPFGIEALLCVHVPCPIFMHSSQPPPLTLLIFPVSHSPQIATVHTTYALSAVRAIFAFFATSAVTAVHAVIAIFAIVTVGTIEAIRTVRTILVTIPSSVVAIDVAVFSGIDAIGIGSMGKSLGENCRANGGNA